MSKKSLRIRLILVFGFLVVVLTVVGYVLLGEMRRTQAEVEHVVNHRWNKVKLSRQAIALSTVNHRITMQVFLLDSDQQIAKLLQVRSKNSQKITEILSQLKAIADPGRETQLLHLIDNARVPYVDSYKWALDLLIDKRRREDARAMLVGTTLPLLEDYHEAWNTFVQFEGERMDAAVKESSASYLSAHKLALFLILLSVAVASATAAFVIHGMTKHISRRELAERVLQDSLQELEVRVAERTAELAAANEGLTAEVLERKNAEFALRASEERYRDLFENAHDIIYTHDLTGNYTSVNKASEKITGYTRAESLRMNMIDAIAPEYLKFVREVIRAKSNQSSQSAYEIEIITRDGRRVTLEVQSRLAYTDGKPSGVQGIARDITERKRADKERAVISEIVQTLNVISDVDELLSIVHHSLGKVLYAENCYVALFNRETGNFEMQYFVDQQDEKPEPQPFAKSRTAYVFRSGQPALMTDAKFLELQRDNEVEVIGSMPRSWLGVPLATPAGVIGVLVVQHYSDPDTYSQHDLQFLTAVGGQVALAIERKRAAEALRRSSAILSAVIEGTADSIFVKDLEGRYLMVNPSAANFIQKPIEEIINKTDYELYPPETALQFVESDRAVIEAGETGLFEGRAFANGEARDYLATKNLYRNESGQVVGLIGIAHDITERKRMEAQLKEARDVAVESARLKSEFLANMSHEIRTPMNGIIGMTGLLLDTNLAPDQREFAEIIRHSGDALLTLINDILDLSKIEAGKLQMETLDFELNNVVEGSVELLAQRAREKGIELACLIYHDVPRQLKGDPGRLRQVLTNLIGNAVKFTNHGDVIVRAEKERETDEEVTVRFSVSDTGIGIEKSVQSKLFQAFTQADGSTTRKYGGTGLGLAISKQIVELMSGQIGVKSTAGTGSTFWFTATFQKSASDISAAPILTGSLENVRILIVDDNTTNRRVVAHQISAWGVVHDQAASGPQALELLRAAAANGSPYDLAILDLLMPGIDGFELAHAIKNDSQIAATHLVMLTSHGQRGDGARAKEAGVSAYLTKPVRQSQLFDCLSNVFAKTVNKVNSRCDSIGPPPQLITKHALEEAKQSSRRSILLAEDNLVNQKVAIRQLKKLGYHTDAVVNGREVLDALKLKTYDLILMDCQMPEMDGYEATAAIRQSGDDIKNTRIVAMTANALQGDKEKCLAVGMDDYISKPVRVEELIKVLNRVFAHTNLADSPQEVTI
jgi:two-component system, sensor histidine kinase and response regulator